MEKFDEKEYAELIELAIEILELGLEEELVKPEGFVDPDDCSEEEPCCLCQYEFEVGRLAGFEFDLKKGN